MKKAYIGRSGSGKSTRLLQDLKELLDNKVINQASTLLFVLKNEEDAYRKILPHATYYDDADFSFQEENFETLIIDTFMNQQALLGLNITPDNDFPKNVFWTFQGTNEISNLFPALDTEIKEKLILMDYEISGMKECAVLEIEKY